MGRSTQNSPSRHAGAGGRARDQSGLQCALLISQQSGFVKLKKYTLSQRSAHQVGGEVIEAVAALDAAGDTLADDRAGPGKAGDGRLAPRGVVRMDDARRGAGLDFGAKLDERLEQAPFRRIAIIIL